MVLGTGIDFLQSPVYYLNAGIKKVITHLMTFHQRSNQSFMKKFLFVVLIFSACNTSTSPANPAETSISEWMNREGQKPDGYKPVSFSKADSAFTMPENFVHLREQGQNPQPVFSGYTLKHTYKMKDATGSQVEKTSVFHLDSAFRVIRME